MAGGQEVAPISVAYCRDAVGADGTVPWGAAGGGRAREAPVVPATVRIGLELDGCVQREGVPGTGGGQPRPLHLSPDTHRPPPPLPPPFPSSDAARARRSYALEVTTAGSQTVEHHSLAPITNCLVAVHEHVLQRIIFLYVDDSGAAAYKRSFMLGFSVQEHLDQFLSCLRSYFCVPSAVNICQVDLELAVGIGKIAPLLEASTNLMNQAAVAAK